jgi:16S rRNA (adenine1518-N6/adenine1519-N6)-dimethyltransferase
MKTKKSLGQHWLKDEVYLQAVCDAGLVHEHDTVLEVGPGLGTLTDKLLAKSARVIAVEKDENLASDLQHKYRDRGNYVHVVNGDILDFDLSKLPANYKVVANIPYYLTSNLIRVLSEAENPPKVIALLVQKEVAERIAAKPGEMSLLSVSAQAYYEPHLEEVVPARFFSPPPKVDSQIIQLLRREEPFFAGVNSKDFFRTVKAGFHSRRKTLENSLSGGLNIDKEKCRQILNKANINPSSRPQELSLEQWVKLANEL